MRRRLTAVVGVAVAVTAVLQGVPSRPPAPPVPVAATQVAPTAQRISTDPFAGGGAQHAAEVEAGVAAWGSTVVSAFQVGRYASSPGSMGVGWATSADGGATWASGILPGVTKASTPAGPYPNTADNVVAYDAASGTWLIGSLGIGPQGGRYTELAFVVSRSTDGVHWGAPVTISAVAEPDKGWLRCDNTPSSRYYGRCYAVYSSGGFGDTFEASVSTDGGLTWSAPTETAGLAAGYDVQPVVAPDGTVVVVATQNGSVVAYRSTDGGASWSAPVTVSPISHHKVAGGLREKPKPTVAVDASGLVYAVWSDCRFRASCSANDLVVSTSTGGVTWSPVRRIPLTATSATDDFFLPALGADPATGGSAASLALSYYHYGRAACGTKPVCSLDVGVTSSIDSGGTWSPPTTVRSGMNPKWLPSATGGTMAGDYLGTTFSQGNAVSVVALAGPRPTSSSYDVAMHAIVYGPNTVAVSDAHAVALVGGPSVARFTVALGAPQAGPVSVDYATVAGSGPGAAAPGVDYQPVSGRVTVPAGASSVAVDVPVPTDTVAKPPRSFGLQLSGAVGATLTRADATGTVVAELGAPALAVGDVTVAERSGGGAVTASFPVVLSAPTDRAVTVAYATADGSATVTGGDYTRTVGLVTLPAGATGATVAVPVASDGRAEPAETFRLALSTPTGAVLGDASGTATVLSPEGPPTLAIDDVAVVEGDTGQVTATVPVRLAAPTDRVVTATYTTASGTATAGSDFLARSGTVTVPAGATAASIAVPVLGDTVAEPNETFTVTLSGPGGGAVLADATAVVTVVDDDAGAPVPPPPPLSVSDATVIENADGSPASAGFTVGLPAPATAPVTVSFATAGGSATAGADFTTRSGSLMIPAGATSAVVAVPVASDNVAEPAETFTLTLSGPSGAVLGDATGVATIYSAAGAPALAVADATVVEGTGGTRSVTVAVTLAAPTDRKVTVSFATKGATATAGSDFAGRSGTATFPPGVTRVPIAVTVYGDATAEPDETFTVSVSSPKGGAYVADAAGVVTVLDDD